jgi:hypothetical protein
LVSSREYGGVDHTLVEKTIIAMRERANILHHVGLAVNHSKVRAK